MGGFETKCQMDTLCGNMSMNVTPVKVMPSSLLQSDGGAFIHMIMVGTFTIGSRVL